MAAVVDWAFYKVVWDFQCTKSCTCLLWNKCLLWQWNLFYPKTPPVSLIQDGCLLRFPCAAVKSSGSLLADMLFQNSSTLPCVHSKACVILKGSVSSANSRWEHGIELRDDCRHADIGVGMEAWAERLFIQGQTLYGEEGVNRWKWCFHEVVFGNAAFACAHIYWNDYILSRYVMISKRGRAL